MRKLPWKKIIIRTCWVLMGIGVIVILGAAMISQSRESCKGIRVTIESPNIKMLFVNEQEIKAMLDSTFAAQGKTISQLPLRSMEMLLERNPWIAEAEIYVDNNQILQAQIRERVPVARIFTLQENSFYIDSSGVRLPLSDHLTAQVPVFTDFPSDNQVLSAPDSALMAGIISISQFLAADSLWMALVSQVAILPGNQFEMFLLTGTPTIQLGDASHLSEKFKKLNAYFRSDYFKMGYGKYARINVQYRNQLIGIKADSIQGRNSIDSAGFYRAVEGIARGVDQMNSAINAAALSPANQPAILPPIGPEKALISKDKNIEKSYNKTPDSALSKKALLNVPKNALKTQTNLLKKK